MISNQVFKRTRVAPTPSGFLHAGNILSFAITAALARETKASILLRIDDLDQERAEERYVRDIFDTLQFLGIPWDEGPRDHEDHRLHYSQVHRMDRYRSALGGLVATGRVFACGCSRTDIARESPDGGYPGTCRDKGLALDMPGVSWRLRTDDAARETMGDALSDRTEDGVIKPTDGAAPDRSGDAVMDPSVRDCVIRKKDGMPAYQLTSVIDDLYFDVDLVVRGQDLEPSTMVQRYLARQLAGNELEAHAAGADAVEVDAVEGDAAKGDAVEAHALNAKAFEGITFIHHPLLTDSNGQKLSKSAGAMSIHAMRRSGRRAEDVYGLISDLLGAKTPAKDFQGLAAAARVLYLSGQAGT